MLTDNQALKPSVVAGNIQPKKNNDIRVQNSAFAENILIAIFENTPVSIYVIDDQYELMAVSQHRANRIGLSPHQLIGKKCYQALYGLMTPCPDCEVQKTIKSGIPTVRIDHNISVMNTSTAWEINTCPIYKPEGDINEVIILERDITEELQLEEKLIQSEKLAAIGQLAAGLAHEINNPLSAIIANAQLIKMDIPEDNDLQESVKLIELAGKRASQVVRNLLDFARKENMEFHSININETITTAIKLMKHELLLNNVNLALELDSNLPETCASADHLQGVWINLLLNSLDAFKGTMNAITISTKIIRNEFLITFSDNGIGMDNDQIKHAFEPFYTTKGPGKGTGLGLSVCHRVIKQHGGNISVQSKPSAGTKIIVSLPSMKHKT